MEEVLDTLPPSDRSRFVREAIHYFLSKKKDNEGQRTTKKDIERPSSYTPQEDTKPKEEVPSMGEGVEDTKVVDVDKMLDNLYD